MSQLLSVSSLLSKLNYLSLSFLVPFFDCKVDIVEFVSWSQSPFRDNSAGEQLLNLPPGSWQHMARVWDRRVRELYTLTRPYRYRLGVMFMGMNHLPFCTFSFYPLGKACRKITKFLNKNSHKQMPRSYPSSFCFSCFFPWFPFI